MMLESSFTQSLTSVPTIPVANAPVSIFFDSSQETGDLKDYTGDLYTHTGVILEGSAAWKHVIGSWGNNTNQPKLTYLGNYTYSLSITPDINSFYSVQPAEIVEKMAFVIRSDDASKQTADLFINVFEEGLNINLISPEKSSLVVELNDQIAVEASGTLSDSLSLFINNEFITSGSVPSQLSYTINADTYGEFHVLVKAFASTDIVADSFFYYVRPPITVEAIPSGIIAGINYISDTTVILALYAPNKNYVFAIGDFSDWVAREDNYMNVTPDGSTYWVELTGLIPEKEYLYQYFVDGTLRIGDPYADKVIDSWNDKWIDTLTYPDLPLFPEDQPSGIATVFQTAQQKYQWKNTSFESPENGNLVIYELLIRDFLAAHDYNTLIDTLDYLDKLGINAIELMPVNEFEGNESWGYNPSYYFAPDKYYGSKNDLKEFIDSCHSRGIAVLLDMVLNHSMSQSPLAQLYWDPNAGDWGQPSAENPWYNQTSPNPVYSWGSDFNHESNETKNFIDRVNRYWLTEFKVDGFRFDFTKGFTNTPGDGWAYDQSRINLLKRMADSIWTVNDNAIIILEHFTDNNEEKILTDYGMLIWGNLNCNYNQATMGYPSGPCGSCDFKGISYQQRGWSLPGLVGYMESHDEERLMAKNLEYGNSGTVYNIQSLSTALRRIELAGTFFFTIPGPKMIWQFEELGYDFHINYPGVIGEDTHRTAKKPIRWDYFQNPDRKRLYQVFSALINLKKENPVFQTTNYSQSFFGKLKRINLYHSSMDAVVIGNFDVASGVVDPNFSQIGTWYEFFSGDTLEVTNPTANLPLNPGEYRLYTTGKLNTPELIVDIENPSFSSYAIPVIVYPNPSQNLVNIKISPDQSVNLSVSIFDITGREVIRLVHNNKINDTQTFQWNFQNQSGHEVDRGIYLVKIQTNQRIHFVKVIRQ